MTTFFTADLHLGHARIIDMCQRPFEDLTAMHLAIADNWNAVVTDDDDVHIVGDFAYKSGGKDLWRLFHYLRGNKHLTIGNHDNKETLRLPWASPPEHRRHLVIDGASVVLDHYAGRTWYRSNRKSIQLYGHSHGRLPGNDQSLDVGVDAWDFRPVTLPEIRARLATLPPFHYQEDPLPEPEGFKP